MVDKNVFTQELKKVFTILKEIKVVEKYVKELIDNNNLTEDKVIEFEEKLDQYKRDLDYVNENTELLQESLNQININLEDLIEYIDSIKDFINQNENTTEVGGNLEVDGNITINSVDNLITKDGSSFGGGGNQLYCHSYEIDLSPYSNGYITFICSYPNSIIDNIREFNNWLNEKGYTKATPLIANGLYLKGQTSTGVTESALITGIYGTNNETLSYRGAECTYSSSRQFCYFYFKDSYFNKNKIINGIVVQL